MSKPKPRLYVLIMVCQHNTNWSFNTLVPKVLEPNIYIWWCMSSSPILTCVVSFLSLYTCFYLYAIYYFYFTQRCLDEFCLKCFRNTSCQSLLVINSLFAKFFKSLCYDRFYCIQQVNMSWVIYDFSHMFICLLWFCHGLPNEEIVRTYVTILCNWLIFWQNALYLFLGRSRMCSILQETLFQVPVLKPCKSIQESSEKVLNFKTR